MRLKSLLTTIAVSSCLWSGHTFANAASINVILDNQSPFKVERICTTNVISDTDYCQLFTQPSPMHIDTQVRLNIDSHLILIRMIDPKLNTFHFSSVAADLKDNNQYYLNISPEGELVIK